MGRIERLFGMVAERRGRASEGLVCAALEEMAENGEIESFERIEPNSELDTKGIDFLIIRQGKKLSLQVKSSRFGLKRAREKHPRILAIRACPGDPIKTVCQRIKGEFRRNSAKYRRRRR